MNSRRTARVAQAILETVSTTVLFELRDPRIQHVTITGVEVTPDIRHAKVYVSVMGDEKTQTLTMHGLDSARGFLQKKIADRLQTRYTPVLQFELDLGLKYSAEASRVLKEVLEEEGPALQEDEPEGESADSPDEELD